MKIIINSSSMVPIYEQIVDQIKAQIVSGDLKENDILPSVRGLAKDLKISALTVRKHTTILNRTVLLLPYMAKALMWRRPIRSG